MTYMTLLNQQVNARINAQQQFKGTIEKVGDNYILLHDETIGSVILPTEHLKQIQWIPNPPLPQQTLTLNQKKYDPTSLPNKLIDVLRLFNQTVIQIEGGGSEPTIGYVMGVKEDYVTLCVIPDGFVYYPVRHVLSILPRDVDVQPEFVQWIDQHTDQVLDGEHFIAILQHEIGKVVKFGRSGPEVIFGILRSANEQYAELVVSPNDVVWIPLHHIKSLTRYMKFAFSESI